MSGHVVEVPVAPGTSKLKIGLDTHDLQTPGDCGPARLPPWEPACRSGPFTESRRTSP